MSEKLTWPEHCIILVAVIGALSIFIPQIASVTRDIPKEKMGDIATWFGAIFAGLAFFGTIGLAFQRSHAEKQARDRRAYAVVASIALHVLRWIQALERAAMMLTFDIIDGEESTHLTRNQATELIQSVQNINISSDDLAALTVLDGKDAFRLALAISLLDSLKADLDDEKLRNSQDRILLKQESTAHIRRLDRITRLARVVAISFIKITDEQAPHPNDDEVWEDRTGQ